MPLFPASLSLQWARDCFGERINWAALGVKGPLRATPNVDEEAEWLRRTAIELRLPGLRAESAQLARGYGMSMVAPGLDLLNDPRSIDLANLVLEHRPDTGVRLTNGAGSITVRIGHRAYGLFGQRSMASEARVGMDDMYRLENERCCFADLLMDD